MAQPASNPKIEELRFRLKSDPKSRLFFPLAEELRKVDQFDEAEQVLRSGLTQHPAYLSAWVSLGRVLHEAKKNRDAVEALSKALQLDPGNVVAARLLADAHFELGDKVEAIKKYKLVRALLPADDEELEVVIERLDREINAAPAPFMTLADSTHPPAPVDETPFATHDSQAFDAPSSAVAEEQAAGETTADIEPMKAAHTESPFEEPVTAYTAAAVEVEQPKGIHIETAPVAADAPTPWTDEEAASDVFAPAETPPPAQAGDVASTVIMADLYVRQGFDDKAREIYENILKRDPENRGVREKLEKLGQDEEGSRTRNAKTAKLEKWLAKVKKREEGSVV